MLHARRALVSVSNKDGLVAFARGLTRLGIEILSTGGTRRHLEEAGIPVVPVAEVTGYPEILDGRVKTLHPRIHGGILADRARAAHLAELKEHDIAPIDLVVVNLYPFRETVRSGGSFAEVVEMIDIGGPCLVRAAAKNYSGVAVVVEPDDYTQVLAALENGEGVIPEVLRRSLALKAFRHTQAYDAAIAHWLEGQVGGATPLPRHWSLGLVQELSPRYGENPHQQAVVYRIEGGAGVLGGMVQHQGKQLSWNNLLDADAARRLAALFAEPVVAIVKHNNPCGVGRGDDLAAAFQRALASDPVSAFGSIVAVNRAVDRQLVVALGTLFVEVLVAPGYDDEALAALAPKENLRVLGCPAYAAAPGVAELRAIDGGYLAQTPDDGPEDPAEWSCPTARQPSEEELAALDFAWKVARHVKSNAMVLANTHQTVGIGAGQMSRVDACHLAVSKAQLPTAGSVAASDAFFPFRDGLDVLARAGVRAVAQPGGSKRDDEVIAAADEHDIAMLFTGRRHFKH
ncbi:MAG TPA: bifunctional phosphoribosylaminoimidazolecarboxamide formyltransferase/IMP cyclohydrolase [Thermoanaerobaculia bacterium]|nr:bifunctional phosphoribosylaminoimidazolecarboxamide formyltransferase/IMP cyclohydrolase [Thermoanaerobaculia bacterium]